MALQSPPGSYTKQPVNRIGQKYQGELLRPILTEIDRELRRIHSMIATLGGSGLAPTDASYVTIAAEALLSAERRLIGTSRISITDGGAGSTVTVDAVGSALTRTNSDANIALTLTGTPSSALLAAVDIVAGWTGQLSVPRGGTGLASGTSGGILGFTSTTTLASSALLVAGALLLGGGAGATPTTLALGTANRVVGMNSGATAHEYKDILGTADEIDISHGVNSITIGLVNPLIVSKGGTNTTSWTGGAIAFGNGTLGGTATALTQDSSNLVWNDTDNRLGIRISLPTEALHMAG